MTADGAIAESPTLMAPRNCPVTLLGGADESAVFLYLAEWLPNAWNANLVIEAQKRDFDVVEGLKDSLNR